MGHWCPHSAHSLWRRAGLHHRRGSAAGGCGGGPRLSHPLLLAAAAGSPAATAKVSATAQLGQNHPKMGLPAGLGGGGLAFLSHLFAFPTQFQCHGEGEAAAIGQGCIQAQPAGEHRGVVWAKWPSWGGGDSLSYLLVWEERLQGKVPRAGGYHGADTALSPQAPVLYAMLDHSRSTKAVSEKKAKGAPGDSRKDKK